MNRRTRHARPGLAASIDWRRLAGVALPTLLLAIAIGGVTVEHLTQSRVPQVALSIDPGNARAKARLAEMLFARDQQKADVGQMLGLSRASLRRQSFNPEAMRTIALGYALQDNIAKARPAFRVAGQLSKRDAPTNIWLIEDAVQRDSVPDALALFDRSLRVEDNLRPVLFPVLASALSDPVIAKAAVPIFEARPVWARFFVKYAMDEGNAAPALAFLTSAKPSEAERAGGLRNAESGRQADPDRPVRDGEQIISALRAQVGRRAGQRSRIPAQGGLASL